KAKDGSFELPLCLQYADSKRAIQHRTPLFELQHLQTGNTQFFEDGVKIHPASDEKSALRLQLTPIARLPESGVNHQLEGVLGDFSEKVLRLHVCEMPSIRIQLSGDAIEADPDSDRIVITESSSLDVNLELHAEDGPVVIREDVGRDNIICSVRRPHGTDVRVILRLREFLSAGTVIYPGSCWSTSARFETGDLIEGDIVSIRVRAKTHVVWTDPSKLKLELVRIDPGRINFTPSTLHVDEMFLGECRSNAVNDLTDNPEGLDVAAGEPAVIRRITVKNCRAKKVTIGQPVKSQKASWLTVRWADDVKEGVCKPHGNQLELQPGDCGELYIRIDLRNVPPEALSQNGSLSAKVTYRDLESDDEGSEFSVFVNKVRKRLPCPHPLCIDFGNTSSFAAIRNPYDADDNPCPPWLTDEIISVHDLGITPERFPTALFFDHLASDLKSATYRIGHLAVTASEKHGALVTDLKRWIGNENHNKTVVGPLDEPRACDVPRLIVWYLLRLLERAEAILRRYTITEVCVSHPSKYTLQRREAFFEVIDEFCSRASAERDVKVRHVFAAGRQQEAPDLKARRYRGVDEANAVAVGAVFDSDVRKILATIVKPERPSFTVASFDLGGGSLDTAIIRFNVRKGLIRLPRFTTEYLAIGGDDRFGGDHVTFVVFDLLQQQIAKALQQAGLNVQNCMNCIPSPELKDRTDPDRIRNYQVLWKLAEEIKIFRCTYGPEPDAGALETLKAKLGPFSQDLILDPGDGVGVQRDDRVTETLQSWMTSGDYLVTLDEIYDHKVSTDLATVVAPWSVRSRIKECISELADLACERDVKIDLVIRCGKGSRLPLVDQMLGELDAKILPDASSPRTKFLVAHGLVRFLEAGRARHTFARSSDYTCSAFSIGERQLVEDNSVTLFPNCYPVDPPEPSNEEHWRAPRGYDNEELTLDDLNQHANRIEVFRVDARRTPTLHGWFDLTHPPNQNMDGTGDPLSTAFLEQSQAVGRVRLNGSERSMELRVDHGVQCIGIWEMQTPTSNQNTT
ncbi:MAG: hypothetical protein ABGZ35_25580, partial [Planctomycetaceae bacterium]